MQDNFSDLNQWIQIGTIVASHGLKGEVTSKRTLRVILEAVKFVAHYLCQPNRSFLIFLNSLKS